MTMNYLVYLTDLQMLAERLVNRGVQEAFCVTLIKEQQGQIRSAGLQFHPAQGACFWAGMHISKKAQAMLDHFICSASPYLDRNEWFSINSGLKLNNSVNISNISN